MLVQVQQKTMPPFNASEESDCTPRFGWKDDPRLSAQELQTIADWVNGGAPAGTKTDIAVPAAQGLAGVTQTLVPSVPWSASGARDQFICTILDPQSTGAWLTGLQVRPGNAKVVHKLKSGQAGTFIADLQVPSATDTIQAQVTFTVGKKTVGPLILGNQQTASDGSILIGAAHKFKVKKTTAVVAHLQVQDGTQQATKDLSFKVTK